MSASKCAVYQETTENAARMAGPAIHPRVDIAQARDKTPDPTTEVIICAVVVKELPVHIAWLGGAVSTVRALGVHHWFAASKYILSWVIVPGKCSWTQ